MTSIDPRGPRGARASRDSAPRDMRPVSEADRRRALSRSTLWPDAERGPGVSVGPQPLRARWDPVPPPRDRVGQRSRVPERNYVGRSRRRRSKRRSTFGWFIHHYGWRAYAIPVLAALTVVAVVGIVNSPGSDADDASVGNTDLTQPVTPAQQSVATVTVTESGVVTTITRALAPDGSLPGEPAAEEVPQVAADVPVIPAIDRADAFRGVVMGLLPPGPSFAKTGAGTFHTVPGTSKRIGTEGRLRTFTIEVEDGISSPTDDAEFAAAVMDTLSGPGSWAAGHDVTLQRVDSGDPDFRISLTSQMTSRDAEFCGWDVQLEASCYNQAIGRVVINVARWVRGAYTYGDDMTSYRAYAINHEVGHALGQRHEGCPADGAIAPVMMQQSWSTADDDVAALNPGTGIEADGHVCRANPFPYPDRVDG